MKALKISISEWQSLMIAFEMKGHGEITLEEWNEVLAPKLDAERKKYEKIEATDEVVNKVEEEKKSSENLKGE